MSGNRPIRNIYCVGRNYRLHAAELGNAVPDEPMLFTKPDHALAALDGSEIAIPGSKGEVHYEMEIVVRVGRTYEKGIRADELLDGMALGLDLTLREVQNVLKQKGYPWLAAKGFRNSAPITAFRPFPGIAELRLNDFVLMKNGVEAQRGNAVDMIFNLQALIDYCAEHYGIGEGDVLFTGTPAGVGPVADGDRFRLLYAGEPWGSGHIRLL